MSTSLFLGVLCFSAVLSAQMTQSDGHHMLPSEDFGPAISVIPDWPAPSQPKPISAVVSLRELQHPISNKALRAAYDAQQLANAGKIPQAIAKLEKAIRIDPGYRDAHCNLGVMYARVGRIADARAEFQKALAIGTAAAPIYADLALASAASGEFIEAETFARQALRLDPADKVAQMLLENAPR